MQNPTRHKPGIVTIIVVCAVLFSILTVYLQVISSPIPWVAYYEKGHILRGSVQVFSWRTFLEEGSQLHRHQAVLEGTAKDPWQYRILSEYLVEGYIIILTKLEVPYPTSTGFISFRFLQNLLLFLFAAWYYKKLGLNTYVTLIGLSFMAWGMTHSFFDSDLQFNTYFDLLFYLLAGLVILYGKFIWIIPITILAALNRETSGLIPFLLIAATLDFSFKAQNKKAVGIAVFAGAIFIGIFFGLRYIYGPRELFIPYEHPPGIDLFLYNMIRRTTWVQLFATLSILPILAIYSMRQWPYALKVFFWTIVPIWFLVHAFTSVMAETRLFLVPQVLIFIPGALLGLKQHNE